MQSSGPAWGSLIKGALAQSARQRKSAGPAEGIFVPEGPTEATREFHSRREKWDKRGSDLFPWFYGEAEASLASGRQDEPRQTQARQSGLPDQGASGAPPKGRVAVSP